MLETVKFPVGECPRCATEVLLQRRLDDRDALILACAHCDTPMPADFEPRFLGARGLLQMGYLVEGEIEQRGCGSSGGASCGGSCSP